MYSFIQSSGKCVILVRDYLPSILGVEQNPDVAAIRVFCVAGNGCVTDAELFVRQRHGQKHIGNLRTKHGDIIVSLSKETLIK